MDISNLESYKGFLESQISFTNRLINQKLLERDDYLKEMAVIDYQIDKLNHE